MFRAMRRKKQALSEARCEEVLRCGEYGVLAVQGDDDYPYAVPLNYVYVNGNIYFHCARDGHKIDAIQRSDKASFCVVAKDDIVAEKFTSYFESVIVFGRVRIVADADEAMSALEALVERLTPDAENASKRAELDKCWKAPAVTMLCLEPEHVSGKQAKELIGAGRAAE